MTYAHDFIETRKTIEEMSYDATVCSKCNLEVFEYGNADGSLVGTNKVQYYITGNWIFDQGDIHSVNYHIVIYGNGPMPDTNNSSSAQWKSFLNHTKEITIAEGITTIGSNAFNNPDVQSSITVNMADTVKVIKNNALNIPMKTLILGSGIEHIEKQGIYYGEMSSIYWPKSLKVDSTLNSGIPMSLTFFYEGSKDEYLSIQTTNYANNPISLRTFLSSFYEDSMWYSSVFNVYLNASQIGDRSQYFDMEAEWR